MSHGVWQLTVKGDFAAAHALRCYHGKCENLHGHNYTVEIVVEGEELLPGAEYLCDFTELKVLLKEITNSLDHRYLNETPPFDRLNPSSENLARYIWQQMSSRLPHHVRMVRATVAETPKQSATYFERRSSEQN